MPIKIDSIWFVSKIEFVQTDFVAELFLDGYRSFHGKVGCIIQKLEI
jgi:hypothetical protein